MAEQTKQQAPQTPKVKDKPPKRAGEWGLTEADVLEALAGKPVAVEFASGAHFTGSLVGYDQFHLVLKIGDAVMLLGKGQVEYIHAA